MLAPELGESCRQAWTELVVWETIPGLQDFDLLVQAPLFRFGAASRGAYPEPHVQENVTPASNKDL
jgi:hypothetical protein